MAARTAGAMAEASTATIILPGAAPSPFTITAEEESAKSWIYDAPGEILRAILIEIVETDDLAEAIVDQGGFDWNNLVSCIVAGGARFWSDFKLGNDGFGRLLIAANGMSPYDLGRAVQRFQEMGNYRNLALLGLKVTQNYSAKLADHEAAAVAITQKIVSTDDDDALLGALIDLAAQTTELMAKTAYRMSATQAYCDVALDRMQGLQAESINGFQTLAGFTERRLLPAARTCRSFAPRLESLADRIERATAELHTRIEMRIQKQNSEMLASMNESATMQLKLQHLVEGLSVVGVSYYAMGLLSYVAKGLAPNETGISTDRLVAFSAPAVIIIVWLFIRFRVRRVT